MRGFKEAEAITKKHARTFYFASRFLKKSKRSAAYAIYSLCRISDEAVDSTIDNQSAKNLIRLKEDINSAYSDSALESPLLQAFRQTVKNYRIPKEYFDKLIEGIHMDLEKSLYQNFEELYKYCYKVAGVVGLIMLRIFGCDNGKAKGYAVNLGIAMQLTNILRDIKEDYNRGRIYLPQEEMELFKVSQSDISDTKVSKNFKALLEFQIARARQYYTESAPGIKMLPDANSRFVVSVMAGIYSGILDSIEENNYDVLTKRAYVGNVKKTITALKILLGAKYL